jgi:hypothetical protein
MNRLLIVQERHQMDALVLPLEHEREEKAGRR